MRTLLFQDTMWVWLKMKTFFFSFTIKNQIVTQSAFGEHTWSLFACRRNKKWDHSFTLNVFDSTRCKFCACDRFIQAYRLSISGVQVLPDLRRVPPSPARVVATALPPRQQRICRRETKPGWGFIPSHLFLTPQSLIENLVCKFFPNFTAASRWFVLIPSKCALFITHFVCVCEFAFVYFLKEFVLDCSCRCRHRYENLNLEHWQLVQNVHKACRSPKILNPEKSPAWQMMDV